MSAQREIKLPINALRLTLAELAAVKADLSSVYNAITERMESFPVGSPERIAFTHFVMDLAVITKGDA